MSEAVLAASHTDKDSVDQTQSGALTQSPLVEGGGGSQHETTIYNLCLILKISYKSMP